MYLRGGKILWINLTDRTVRSEPIEPYMRKYVGGKAINARILFDKVAPEVKPFDPDNLLLIGAGPLVGTPFPGACRIDVTAKSPVTGTFGNADMGGYFGAELKFAGYDHLIIDGKADKPVYIHIKDDNIEIKDASKMWGHDTYETTGMVKMDTGDMGAPLICIGPAGENRVIYASIMSPTGNAAARTGLGAVMGSKNLKAISVRGTRGIKIARVREFLNASYELRNSFKPLWYYQDLHNWGLTRIHDKEMRDVYKLIGTRFEGQEDIWEGDFAAKNNRRGIGCFSCPIACFDSYNVPEVRGSGCAKCSPYGDLTWDLRNPSLMVFWKAFVLCQRYGIDARSVSNILAWLMELSEKGIINTGDTGGMVIKWGDPDVIPAMIKAISLREGFGDVLAEGLPFAAAKIGKDSDKYLLMSHGSPADMHLTTLKSRGLAAAVSPIGEDAQLQPPLDLAATFKYIKSPDEDAFQQAIKKYKDRAEMEIGVRDAPDPRITQGKAALVFDVEKRTSVCDITGVCSWTTSFIGLPVNASTIANFMTIGLGEPVTGDDLDKAGQRMKNVERAFCAMTGLTRKDDKVSAAYYNRMRPNGEEMAEINFNDTELETMKDDYYRMHGWDIKTGNPKRNTLEKLDMADIADRLGI